MMLFQTKEEIVLKRMEELSESLQDGCLPHSPALFREIRFSYGIAAFSQMTDIEKAIDQADAAMYARKQTRKTSINT